MKRRNRDINVFNLSMLDVILGAMAAFLIIMVVLLPYYKKEHIEYQADTTSLRRALADAQAAAASAVARAEAAEAEALRERGHSDALASRLAKTFLVLYIRWGTLDDIDLHVVDPTGAEFYWERRTVAGRPGELSEDNVVGPGAEVWEVREAPPGEYRASAKLFRINDTRKPVVIKGRTFFRDGSRPLREVALHTKGEKALLAVINVAADGSVTVR
ncbi:hypothetical protein F2Q65_01505 [Thiohalocapsa marina]|uniref:DUF2135 domain-containing protein n=1 Tax=Thiohalocapsa marina TaxID=424902 RepID=A0A5M8FVT0_9GAMM|nr:hypothetical protein [Thiohalocapsa marina]KAA6187932.1 hypothetical protein F2Q65_01505 [Thiohalocapsa marina]